MLNITSCGVYIISLAKIYPPLEVWLFFGEVKVSPFRSIGNTIIISAIFYSAAHLIYLC